MHSVDLFAEDRAHELFVSAIIRRVLSEAGTPITLNVRSAVGGHGRALTELKTYQRAVTKEVAGLVRPDLLVAVIDTNCKGVVQTRNAVAAQMDTTAAAETIVVCPDPHIERWFFADPGAFKQVVGVAHQPGRRKCERGVYKKMLKDAVARAGHTPTLDGLEFALDLVDAMDLHRASRNEPSLADLIDELRAYMARTGIARARAAPA